MFTRQSSRIFAAALIVALFLAAMTGAVAVVSGARTGARPLAPEAGAPTVVSYQGKVYVGGTIYSGTGYFKFAVVDSAGTTSFWSNDGTSSTGGQPTNAVQLTVNGGLFTVLLGDTSLPNMTQPLAASVFSGTGRYLRIWFSADNLTYTQLIPDQRMAAVPFALQAEEARNADTLDGQQGSSFQARVNGSCGVGSTIRAVNADGTVICESHDARPGFLRTAVASLPAGYRNAMAIGSDGLPLIVYYDQSTNFMKALHCMDLACLSWSVNTFSFPGVYQSIAIGGDGLPIISYNLGSWGAGVVHCEDRSCSTTTQTNLLGCCSSRRNGTSIAIGVDGLALISYTDPSGRLITAHCDNLACTSYSQAGIDFDYTTKVGEYSSLAIGSDGLGLISYFDNGNQDLKVAHCSDIPCTTATISVVDPNIAAPDGSGRQITIGSDGLGILAYHDTSGVAIAHCDNLLCSSVTTTRLNTPQPPYFVESITIGSDGLPIVAYYEEPTNDLVLIHCSNYTCTQSTRTYLATPDNDGYYPALAIGSDGMPILADVNKTDLQLEIVHCSNWLCIPYWQRP
jgi:hypothetical protein